MFFFAFLFFIPAIKGEIMSLIQTKNNGSSRITTVRVSEIDKLSNKLLDLELELNSNIPTTLWISDLHGEGDRFKSILAEDSACYTKPARKRYPIPSARKKFNIWQKSSGNNNILTMTSSRWICRTLSFAWSKY